MFSSYTIVFIGISADDVAAGGFLEAMTSIGIDAGNHFWITSRTDKATNDWCRAAGVLHVPYSVNPDESHGSVIESIFSNIENYSSRDTAPTPIPYTGGELKELPPLRDLRTLEEDEIRKKLNAHAKYLLNESANQTDTTTYQDFLSNYSPAIHQSWHLDFQQGYNIFFGYHAIEKIHSGPFSSVWRVQNSDGMQYALKIMQIENLRKGPQLDSFRRGIASQKLLRDAASFSGIAKIEAAFEIPPSVIMDFIEGENLEEICGKSNFSIWRDGLDIAINVCKIISDAHRSKFGVLHRDVRPHNIMLPNYYYGDSAPDYGLDANQVVVLNYDMTWHKDASGRVIPADPVSVGYFAPELLNEPDSTRARDARVDSYGVGMTIIRMATGLAPPAGGSSSTEWQSHLMAIKKNKSSWFTSSHNYLSRIVDAATQRAPENRILVSEILSELIALRSALNDGVHGSDLRFIAENLMCEIAGDDFEVNSDGDAFKKDIGGYRLYEIFASRPSKAIKFLFKNASTNTEDWGKIDKAWSAKLSSAREILESGGWKVMEDTSYFRRVIMLTASISEENLRENYEKASGVLQRAIQRLTPT